MILTQFFIWIFGSLSLIGNSIIIVIFLRANIKRIEFFLIFQISVLVCLNALSYMIKNFTSDNFTLCKIQASLILFSELGISITSSIMMIQIYLGINSDQDSYLFEKEKTKKIIIYVISGILPPLIIAIIGYNLNLYNKTDNSIPWCWINENEDIWIVLVFCVIWITIFLNFIIATRINQKFKEIENEEEKSNVKKYVGKLIFFPIIAALTWLPCTFSRLYETFNKTSFDQNYSNYSYVISSVFILGQGCFYALLSLKELEISEFFRNCCFKFCCNKKSQDSYIIDHSLVTKQSSKFQSI